MIKRIKVTGLRGKSFNLELSPLCLVIGPNTAGKTTIADAIRWALLGYIPGMAQPPRGWTELIGNGLTEAGVALELAKGSVQRRLYLEHGSPKSDGMAETGWDEINVLTLDPTRFLEATGPMRAQMVADACDHFEWREVVPKHLQGDDFDNWLKWPNWIEMALNQAKDARSVSANEKKSMAATLRGLESLREIVVEDDTEIKKRLDAGKEKLGSLKEQLRAVTIQIANVKDQPSMQQQLDAVLRALQEFLGKDHDETSVDDRIKDLEQRSKDMEEIGRKIGELPKLRAELAEAQKDVTIYVTRLDTLREEVKKIGSKFRELKKLKRCPTCGSKGANLVEALKIAEDAELQRVDAEKTRTLKQHGEAEADLEQVAKQLEAAEAHYEKVTALEEERMKLQDEVKLIELWKRHDELVAEVDRQSVSFDVQGLQERRYDIECEMQDADEINRQIEIELQQVSFKRSQKKQLEQVETQLQVAEEAWDQQNKMVKELELLRDRLTAMSLEPLLGVMARFTDGIFDEPLSLQGTELGRMIVSRWVPLGQFSGSEQAVAIAALSCALRGNPEHRNLVLADELSAFDDEHLGQFLVNVSKAIDSGAIDQFIGFSTPRKLSASWAGNLRKKLVIVPI